MLQGSVNASFDNSYPPGTVSWYQQTKYGSDYWNATKAYRTARYRAFVRPDNTRDLSTRAIDTFERGPEDHEGLGPFPDLCSQHLHVFETPPEVRRERFLGIVEEHLALVRALGSPSITSAEIGEADAMQGVARG